MKKLLLIGTLLVFNFNAFAGRIVSDRPWHDSRVIRIWEHKKDRFVFRMCKDAQSFSHRDCDPIGNTDYSRDEIDSKVTNERWKAFGVPVVAAVGVAAGVVVFSAIAIPAAVTTSGLIVTGTYLAGGAVGAGAAMATSVTQALTARNPVERVRVTQFLLANDTILETNDLDSVQDLLWDSLREIENKRK